MKVKIPKSHQVTLNQDSIEIANQSYSLSEQTQDSFVLDNCDATDIENLAFIFGSDNITIIQNKIGYSYHEY